MTAMNKQEARTWLRAQHQGDVDRDRESRLLCEHILRSSIYKEAKVVGGYYPMRREADVLPILMDALHQGKMLALPLCEEAPIMTMRRVSSLEELQPGAYGIKEPAASADIIPPEEIDLLLVPLEGTDHAGWRLGKGGSYYDHLLMKADIMTVGCALSWQWLESIPHEPWDQRLRACADQYGIHDFIPEHQRK